MKKGEKTDWKVGDVCWHNLGGDGKPVRLKVVYGGRYQIVGEQEHGDLSTLHHSHLYTSLAEAEAEDLDRRIRDAENDVKRAEEMIVSFKEDLKDARKELRAALKVKKRLGV